jgi:hypothetical protein
MPIPVLPGLASAPCAVYWGSVRQATRLLVGALVADAFETPKELVWNDAILPPEDDWATAATTLDAVQALVRSIADCLREEPVLILVQDGSECEAAWRRLRPLVPCARWKTEITWIHAPAPPGSTAADLAETIGPSQAARMFFRLQQTLIREASSGA